jgi:hypothetical protein
MKSRLLHVAGAVFLMAASAAMAQKTTAWSGAGDGLWSTAANWTNGVPANGVADVVKIIGTESSPYTVNLNGGGTTPNVKDNITTINYATITNGTLDWDNTGSLMATNVTFTDNAKVYRLGTSVTLSNVIYNNGANNFGISGGNGTHRYFGGYLRMRGLKTAPAYGWGTLQTIFMEGYAGPAGKWHEPAYVEIGFATADNGQSFLILKDTRINAGYGYIGWNGDASQGTGQSTLRMTNSLLRISGRINFNTNAIFMATASDLELSAGGGVVTDGLRNRMTNAASFDGEGLTVWGLAENPGMTYEVSGVDTGAVFAGFHDNYSIDQLKFGLRNMYHTTPKIVFTNVYDNNIQPGNEALYVDLITEVDNTDKVGVDPTFTLDLGGLNIYYKKYVNSVTNVPVSIINGSLIQVTGATMMAASPFVHAPEGAQRYAKGAAALSVNSDYGTAIVGGFATGDDAYLDLTVSGNTSDINALRSELGGSGSGTKISLFFDGVGVGGDLFFDWNFSHRSVTLVSFTAVSAPLGTIMTIR